MAERYSHKLIMEENRRFRNAKVGYYITHCINGISISHRFIKND